MKHQPIYRCAFCNGTSCDAQTFEEHLQHVHAPTASRQEISDVRMQWGRANPGNPKQMVCDLQVNLLGALDTPIPSQGRVKNMEVVHDLDATPSGIGLTPAAYAAQDYGLNRYILGGLTMRPTVLTRFSHEFQFGQNNLDGLFVVDTRHQTRLHGRLQVWIGDVIGLRACPSS